MVEAVSAELLMDALSEEIQSERCVREHRIREASQGENEKAL